MISLDYYNRILQRVIDLPKIVRQERAKQLRVDVSAVPEPDVIILKLDPNDKDKNMALETIIDWKDDWNRGFVIELNEGRTKLKRFERFFKPGPWDHLKYRFV